MDGQTEDRQTKSHQHFCSWCGEGFGDQLNTLLERLGKKFMENYNQVKKIWLM
jgi:hypothetical protein